MADLARLNDVIAVEAEALGFELVRVRLTGSGEERTLQIMAEDPATGQMIVDQCATLSRAISARIDEIEEGGEELVEGAYLLEVSSPGIDRPLTRPKDYTNWAGHEARIVMDKAWQGERVRKGTLEGLHPERGIDMVHIKDGDGVMHLLPLDQIHSAQLVLTDRLIAATQPLDMSGADEFVQTTEEEKADD
jgi:ribosome maturation factor RimP